MDYLILTAKFKIQTANGEFEQISYICANGISRCKNKDGKDVLQYVSSGFGYQIPIEDVIALTPSTPTPDQVSALK